MCLAAFMWAIPDERYEYWIKRNIWVYYSLSILNALMFAFGIILAGYFYFFGSSLYAFYAFSIIIFLVLGSGALMMAILSSFFYIALKFYGKPAVPEDSTEEKSLLSPVADSYEGSIKVNRIE